MIIITTSAFSECPPSPDWPFVNAWQELLSYWILSIHFFIKWLCFGINVRIYVSNLQYGMYTHHSSNNYAKGGVDRGLFFCLQIDHRSNVTAIQFSFLITRKYI